MRGKRFANGDSNYVYDNNEINRTIEKEKTDKSDYLKDENECNKKKIKDENCSIKGDTFEERLARQKQRKAEEAKLQEKAPKKKNKLVKIILIIFIIILIIFTAIYFAANGYVNEKLGKIQYENITNDTNDLGISEQATVDDSKFRNICLFGLDSRYDTYDDDYRTDCIMVASINKETNDVTLFSIYRDTFTRMDEDGTVKLDKINHAYYGGVTNTLKTINTNFDLNITEYVTVDFNAVADLVNSVGGIQINITSEELQYINGYIKDVSGVTDMSANYIKTAGTQTLSGVQAVAYARIRYTAGSDYKRAERMRTVLEKVITKLKKMDVTKLDSVMNTIFPEIHTNIKSDDIKTLASNILLYKIQKTFGFPYSTSDVALNKNNYTAKATSENIDYYCIPKTLASNVEKLHKEVFDDEDYVVPDTVKEISNEIVSTTGVK